MFRLWHACTTADSDGLRQVLAEQKEAVLAWRHLNRDTALILTAEQGHTGCVRMLVDAGAGLDVKGEDGNTALIVAADRGHAECVRMLIDAGAGTRVQNEEGSTALMVTAFQGHTKCVRMLIDARAGLNMKDKDDSTALSLAAKRGHVDCVRMLIDAKANITVDQSGKTVAHFAKTDEIRQLLVNHVQPRPIAVSDINLLQCLEGKQRGDVHDLLCSVCHELRFDLHQCDGEGHSVCGKCCGKLRECPHRCGGKLFHPDKRSQRQLRGLASVCPRRCGWRGLLKDAEAHVAQCSPRKIQCSACSQQMQATAWAAHSGQQCRDRLLVCHHCHKHVLAACFQKHSTRFHAACPVPKCGFRGSAARMDKHLTDAGARHTRQLALQLADTKKQLQRRGREVDGLTRKLHDVQVVLMRLLPPDADLPESLLAVSGNKRSRESLSNACNKKGKRG